MSAAATEFSPLISSSQEHVSVNSGAVSDSGGGRRYEEYVRPVLAELVGTTLFVCVGVLCEQYAAAATTSVPGMGTNSVADSSMCVAVSQGLLITVLVTAFGDISGAHVNPAVTFGVLLADAVSVGKTVLYVIAQLAGALLGATLSRVILPSHLYTAIGGGAHTLGSGVEPGEGVLCEVVLTAVLVLTVLVSAVDPRTKSPLAPLAVGFAVIVNVLAGAQITGGSMNPARSFGPAVVISFETSGYWNYHYVYWVGPFLGSLVAGVLYRLLFASGEKRLVFKS
ncbi:aquaporin-8-like [Babylonia areolata]|uniref:aquaporin-8-like n=1 Tax=Babylonia areolata TaxID=304850 RepID=UPI003FD2FC7C